MDAEGEYFVGNALPLDEVDSADVELVGRIAELVARLAAFGRRVGGGPGHAVERHSLDWWMATCREALESLTSVAPRDGWQNAHAYGELARLAAQVDQPGGTDRAADDPGGDDRAGGPDGAGLSLADVRSLLADAFRGRATRANFRTGTLTMCTMLPMRSVPHRVICLLGVDDATFPRHRLDRRRRHRGARPVDRRPGPAQRGPPAAAGRGACRHRTTDRRLLRASTPAPGRASRSRSRSASCWTPWRRRRRRPTGGRSGTGSPPGIRCSRSIGGTSSRTTNTDRSASTGPRSGGRGLRSATASHHRIRSRRPTCRFGRRLPTSRWRTWSASSPIPPGRCCGAGAAPAGRRRGRPPAEQIPIAPDGLESWSIGNRMLQRHLAGIAVPQLAGAEWRRGLVPPAELGAQTLRPIGRQVEEVANAAADQLREPAVGHDSTSAWRGSVRADAR